MGNNIISTATTTVYVNGEHAAKTLQQLKRDAMNLRSSLAEAVAAGDTSKAKGLNKSLREVRREIREIESAAQSAETVMRRLDKATPRELRAALRQLNKELENIERGSEAWKAQVEKIKRVKAEIASLDAETKQHQSLWSRFASMMFNWGDAIDAVSSSVTGLMSATRSAVNAYAEMEQEMANVRKFTGMTAEQVADLNEEFMKMDTRTSREELNKLAQQAGRLGKTSQEDVMGSVRAADKINVALDDLGEDATLTLSKLTGIFGDEKRLGTEKALLSVGSVINELSQNCSASAPYLADFASRMGGVGSQAGMTVQQIMAFGAVLDSNNQAVEASATALSQVIMRIYQEPQKYAQVAGLDIKKFSELVKTDMNSALLMLLESLSKVGKMDVLAPMFKDMGETGARAAAALSTLVGHIDEVKSQQLEANRAFAEAVSVGKEFDVQNNTVQAGLDKAKKRFNELAVSLGEKLLPYMEFAVSMSSVFLRVLRVLVDFLSEHGKSVMTLTAAVVGYYIAAGIAVIKTKALAAAAALHRAASTAQAAAVSLLNIAMLLLKGRLHAAKQEFLAFSTTLKANPLGIILGLLSAAAAALYFFTRQTDAAAEAQNNLNKIRKDAQEEISGEKLKIDLLVKAAKNERLSLEERHKAIDALNRIVPGYNAGLDDTTGKYRENKEALDAYLKSLARKYEIEGAKAKLEELGKTKADAAIEVADAEKKLKKLDKSSMQGSGLVGSDDAAAVAFDLGRREAVLSRMKTAQRRMTLAEETEKLIMEAYGSDLYKNAVEEASKGTGNGSNGGVSGSGAGSAASKSTAAEGDRFKAENKWRAREEALSRIKNATGEIDEEQHQKRMLEIQLEYLQKKMDNEKASADEILQFRAEYAETERKL